MELSDEGDELGVARPRALSWQQWYLPSHFTLTDSNPTARAGVGQSIPGQAPQTEAISFVTPPTIETNPKFFFGAGDYGFRNRALLWRLGPAA
jgi:hypothetical protein